MISIGCGEIAAVRILPELIRTFWEKYDFIRLGIKENRVVLMRPDDPLAEKEYVTAEALLSLPLTATSVLAWKNIRTRCIG